MSRPDGDSPPGEKPPPAAIVTRWKPPSPSIDALATEATSVTPGEETPGESIATTGDESSSAPAVVTGDPPLSAPVDATGNGAAVRPDAVQTPTETRAQAATAARVRPISVTRPAADYTGLVTRAIAFGVDALVIDLAAIVVVAIVALALNLFQLPSQLNVWLAAIGAVLFVVWSAAYFVTFWSTTGQTPGARVMRFRVLAADEAHGHLGPRRALVRLVGMLLAAIPLLAGYAMVLFDDRRRGLHDRVARTVVIDAPDTETPVRRIRARRLPA